MPRNLAKTLLGFIPMLLPAAPSSALPSFAAQTGQPCTACHIGGYGPALTPFGRAFKIGGYTQRGGEGWQASLPLSAMVLTSFNGTGAGQPAPHHYDANNNLSLDQISAFIAGGIGEHTGGFIQLTWSDIPNSAGLTPVHVDNIDLRPFTTAFELGGREARVGLTVNNAPTVQDPYNTTYAWGYPYVMSALAPSPKANPILSNGLVGNSIGTTVYGWYDRHWFLDLGVYNTFSPWTLARIGNDFGIGSTTSPAPYARIAYEWGWDNQAAHIGAIFLHADVSPPNGVPFQTDRSMGNDHYTDFAIDAGYEFLGDGTHIVAVQGIFTHEESNRKGTAAALNAANGTSYASASSLNQIRANVAYWYRNTYGLTLGWQNTWGPANPVAYQPGPLYGSANSSPNSNAFIVEADWVPFGKADSPASPWLNLKLGLQYIAYTRFNGGTGNYDGFGRNAADNNTVFGFVWLSF